MNANDPGRMPPPLSASTAALLAHERAVPSQPEMVRARVLARAREALREAPAAPLPARVAPTRVRRWLFAAAAGLTLMAGVAAAFQWMGRQATAPSTNPVTPRAARQPTVVPPAAAPALASPKEAETTDTTPATATVPALERAPVSSRRTALADKHDGRPDELQLLSRARQSDARGDYSEVLAMVAEHEHSHLAGRLSEEREVLRVKALVGLGRGSEARQAAAKFRHRFPNSVLLPIIEDMVASLQ